MHNESPCTHESHEDELTAFSLSPFCCCSLYLRAALLAALLADLLAALRPARPSASWSIRGRESVLPMAAPQLRRASDILATRDACRPSEDVPHGDSDEALPPAMATRPGPGPGVRPGVRDNPVPIALCRCWHTVHFSIVLQQQQQKQLH